LAFGLEVTARVWAFGVRIVHFVGAVTTITNAITITPSRDDDWESARVLAVALWCGTDAGTRFVIPVVAVEVIIVELREIDNI
jgi:hypothetical protein